MRKICYIYLFLFLSCNSLLKSERISIPDEIVIYSLPQFSHYLTTVECSQVKTKEGLVIKTIQNKKECKDLYSLFEDESNFTIDKEVHDLDARIFIEYKSKGKVVKSICWAPTERVERDGKIYTYSKKIEDYLLSQKLIIKIIK